MTRVKIAELKDHLSEHLRAVERGTEIEVTDRDRPIARLVPIHGDAPAVEIALARRPFSPAKTKRARPARWRGGSLSLLLEERQGR